MAVSNVDLKKLTFAGFLVSIGIVFGDIGTSPLYTFKAIIGNVMAAAAEPKLPQPA